MLADETDAGGAGPHEQLHKLGARNDEEGNTRFAGHGLREEGLAGARGAHQENPFGDAGTDGGVALR